MTFAFVLAAVGLGCALVGWWLPKTSRALLGVVIGALGCLALLGAVVWGSSIDDWPSTGQAAMVVLAGGLAVAGGGPVAMMVFGWVDGRRPGADSVEHAGEVLRGGAWIGGLERAAVFATLVAGWPEGLAVVLAVKGLARYPELRGFGGPDAADSHGRLHGVAERFIIGTFVSVLWAVACAGVAVS